MAGRRGKKAKLKNFFILLFKWISAIVPICAFIYILYHYKQFEFLKPKPVVALKTEVITQVDSSNFISSEEKEKVLQKIKILENEWHPVGGIAIHSLTIENDAAKLLTSVEVEFKYLSDTQAVLTSKIITVKTSIQPGKSAKVSGVSVGYVSGSAVGCDTKVVDAKF